jgi:hypothetical protein
MQGSAGGGVSNKENAPLQHPVPRRPGILKPVSVPVADPAEDKQYRPDSKRKIEEGEVPNMKRRSPSITDGSDDSLMAGSGSHQEKNSFVSAYSQEMSKVKYE